MTRIPEDKEQGCFLFCSVPNKSTRESPRSLFLVLESDLASQHQRLFPKYNITLTPPAMAIAWASAKASTNSLTQKLRDLGRLKSNSKENLKSGKQFEIVHTPDRPSRLITPIEAPTEKECGIQITRWQRSSARLNDSMFSRHRYDNRGAVGQPSLRHPRGRVEDLRHPRGQAEKETNPPQRDDSQAPPLTKLNQQDGSSVGTESDDEADGHAENRQGTSLVFSEAVRQRSHGQQATMASHQPLNSSEERQSGPSRRSQQHQTTVAGFQHGNTAAAYVSEKCSATPAPLFSRFPGSPPSTSHPRSASPALATVVGHNLTSWKATRYTGGSHPHPEEEEEEDPVDMEQLVRMEGYRRGFCPFCHKFFGNDPLPLACPYLDCKRDLKASLQYPNRRVAEKAPPRLTERPILGVQPTRLGGNMRAHGQEASSRKAVPSFTVEAPTPIDERRITTNYAPPPSPPPRAPQRRTKSPSPSNTIRTIWPSPLGIYDSGKVDQPSTPERKKYMDKPLPPPPTPPTRSEQRPPPPSPPSPPTTLSESISDRHQQLYNPQHTTSQLRTPPLSISSTPAASPSPLSRSSMASHKTNSVSPSSPSPHPRASSFRSSVTSAPGQESKPVRPASFRIGDDADFLAWKRPEDLARFKKNIREKGNDADLFMEIIDQYEG